GVGHRLADPLRDAVARRARLAEEPGVRLRLERGEAEARQRGDRFGGGGERAHAFPSSTCYEYVNRGGPRPEPQARRAVRSRRAVHQRPRGPRSARPTPRFASRRARAALARRLYCTTNLTPRERRKWRCDT